MMDQAIKNFAKQFSYQPKIENRGRSKAQKKFVVCGMGGSHLAADILQTVKPGLDIIIHRDYGLPAGDLEGRLIIVSSYSGNTEEAIDSFKLALERKLPLVAISVGGKLQQLAKKNRVPYVTMPDTGIQPRSALGFSFLALLKVMGETALAKQAAGLAKKFKPAALASPGKQLVKKLKGKVPVIYSSDRNVSVAYNWKIKLNETGKIPAFYNIFPELNHNEMTGFDAKPSSRALSKHFHFIFLHDSQDHPRIQKRMRILRQQLVRRGLSVEVLPLKGATALEKIFSSLILADWLAFYTAQQYGLEAEQVPMIEEFKKLMA